MDQVWLFWVGSVVAIGGAVAMVTMRNVVHGALMLVVSLFGVAALFLNLQTSFLAVVQVIVYAGAIVVLFLFVIMLLGVSRDDLLVPRDRVARVGGWLLAGLIVAAVAFVFVDDFTGPASVCGEAPVAADVVGEDVGTCVGFGDQLAEEEGSVGLVARRLFTRYTFAFEFVSLLLIVAIVGAMVVGRRRDEQDLSAVVPPGEALPPRAPAVPPHTHGQPEVG